MKIFVLAFFILSLGCSLIESVNLNCEFETGSWAVLGSVNYCYTYHQGDIITNSSNRYVTTIAGNTNSNPSVKVVDIRHSNCFYFPLDLLKFFINLEGIQIYNSKLREIRRDDFKEYTNLRKLSLGGNKIEFLEQNLFEFNPKLEGIYLNSNKIAHIDVNVFNIFLGKLSYLYLSNNICEFENADDKSKANQIIAKVKSGSCQDISKLPTTTTTPAPPPPVTSAQFDALMKLFEEMKKELEAEKKESTNLQVSLMQEVKALRGEVNGELATLKEKLEATKAEIKDELKRDIKEVKDKLDKLEFNQNETKSAIKEVKDQNLDIKASLGNITAQFEKRIKLIENIVGVDPEHYNQP